MGIKERMSGNEAVAYAIKQVNPDVMRHFRSRRPQRFRRWYPHTLQTAKSIQSLFRSE